MRANPLALSAVLAAAALAGACGARQAPADAPAVHAGAVDTAETRALDFIENDYDAALARARERKTPLFVEVWAPW